MTYSCGIFETLDADVKDSLSKSAARNGALSAKNGRVNGHTNGHANGNGNGNGHMGNNAHVNGNGRVKDFKIVNDKTADPLYDAQMRKLLHIIRKADIKQGHRVLEIGSGALCCLFASIQIL